MKKTEYAHHVIAQYISVSAACTFAIENYRQQTLANANQILRSQFVTCMEKYGEIYEGIEDWSPSVEQLVDFGTVSSLQAMAENNVVTFLNEFKKMTPPEVQDEFDFEEAWKNALEESDNQILVGIYHMIKNLRTYEEKKI